MEKRDKKNIILLLIFLILISGLFLSALVIISNFKVKKIIIISQDKELKGIETLRGKNIFFLDNNTVVTELLFKNLAIDSLEIEKALPHTVIIKTHYKNPVAITYSDNKPLFLDKEGILLPLFGGKNNNLPQIILNKIPIYIDRKADWRIKKAALMITEFAQYGLLINSVTVDADLNYFTIILDNDAAIIMPDSSDITYIAASLQTMISRFRIEGKSIKKINFQFEKPIVIFGE